MALAIFLKERDCSGYFDEENTKQSKNKKENSVNVRGVMTAQMAAYVFSEPASIPRSALCLLVLWMKDVSER